MKECNGNSGKFRRFSDNGNQIECTSPQSRIPTRAHCCGVRLAGMTRIENNSGITDCRLALSTQNAPKAAVVSSSYVPAVVAIDENMMAAAAKLTLNLISRFPPLVEHRTAH